MPATVLGLVLLTACASGGTSGGDGAGAPSTPPAAERPSGPPAGSATPLPPSDDPTAVPPADAAPCPATYDTTGYEIVDTSAACDDTAGAAAAEQPWVPAPPGTQSDGRLAPDADPVEIVLCRYAEVTSGPARLDGAPVRVGTGLQRVRTDLQVPARVAGVRACTSEGPRVPYLARLSYADGDLWVASTDTDNGCAHTGNGVFVSGSSRGGQLAASYDAGVWVPAVGS